ncbi:MAG: hypothetical protein ACJ8E9_08925, partial [Sphingomicrobium sp.]
MQAGIHLRSWTPAVAGEREGAARQRVALFVVGLFDPPYHRARKVIRMRIGRPLLKLPVRFCAETLARDVTALPRDAWLEHPQKYDGNIAVPLVSPGGALSNGTAGPMAATPWLQQCPYILDVMRLLDSTWGRSRLMG